MNCYWGIHESQARREIVQVASDFTSWEKPNLSNSILINVIFSCQTQSSVENILRVQLSWLTVCVSKKCILD